MFLELSIEETIKPVFINTANISSVNGRVVKMNNCDIVTLTDESLHDLMLAIIPKSKERNQKEVDKELVALFEQLHYLTGGKGKPIFSLKREKQLRELLSKHRLAKEDIIRAATNIGKDEFLQGKNDRNKRFGTIDYLLRPDKAVQWADEEEKKKKGMF